MSKMDSSAVTTDEKHKGRRNFPTTFEGHEAGGARFFNRDCFHPACQPDVVERAGSVPHASRRDHSVTICNLLEKPHL